MENIDFSAQLSQRRFWLYIKGNYFWGTLILPCLNNLKGFPIESDAYKILNRVSSNEMTVQVLLLKESS